MRKNSLILTDDDLLLYGNSTIIPSGGKEEALYAIASLDVTLRTGGLDQRASQNLPTHSKMKSEVSRPTARANPSDNSLHPLGLTIGDRVNVLNFGDGTVKFIGVHAKDGKPRADITLRTDGLSV